MKVDRKHETLFVESRQQLGVTSIATVGCFARFDGYYRRVTSIWRRELSILRVLAATTVSSRALLHRRTRLSSCASDYLFVREEASLGN